MDEDWALFTSGLHQIPKSMLLEAVRKARRLALYAGKNKAPIGNGRHTMTDPETSESLSPGKRAWGDYSHVSGHWAPRIQTTAGSRHAGPEQ